MDVKVGDSFSRLAPGAVSFGDPVALSNNVSSIELVIIDSDVSKPTTTLLGELEYFSTITN